MLQRQQRSEDVTRLSTHVSNGLSPDNLGSLYIVASRQFSLPRYETGWIRTEHEPHFVQTLSSPLAVRVHHLGQLGSPTRAHVSVRSRHRSLDMLALTS